MLDWLEFPVDVSTVSVGACSEYVLAEQALGRGGSVVEVVFGLMYNPAEHSTGRNCSWAVWPMRAMTFPGFLRPGSCTTTLPPWELTLAPETPAASTRLRMTLIVVVICPELMACAGL